MYIQSLFFNTFIREALKWAKRTNNSTTICIQRRQNKHIGLSAIKSRSRDPKLLRLSRSDITLKCRKRILKTSLKKVCRVIRNLNLVSLFQADKKYARIKWVASLKTDKGDVLRVVQWPVTVKSRGVLGSYVIYVTSDTKNTLFKLVEF
jgi:hypothetical protein